MGGGTTYAEVEEGVRSALAVYAQALDDGRTDDVVATFCPDGVCEIPGMGTHAGHEALTGDQERSVGGDQAAQLGCQRTVKQLDDSGPVSGITRGHRTLLDILARALADVLDVADERLGLGHGLLL